MSGVPGNDNTVREAVWRRWEGDEWACFDALPPAVRRRMQDHAYDAWAVNAHLLWRLWRRRHASSERAERLLLRHLDRCEALERAAFDAAHRQRHGMALPHVLAGVPVLRGGAGDRAPRAARRRLARRPPRGLGSSVDGPARAGEKGRPCAPAGPRAREQVGRCPRNCQRSPAGPSALPPLPEAAERVTEPASSMEAGAREDRAREAGMAPRATTGSREPGDLPSSLHQAAGRGAPEAGA
ncbi:Hypothetical protein RADP37_04743 [Roseomonas mucosa]|uniref:Uncharacterized protein n=1 Tax=Roseomonas mucosa TaxID=207340 RepID=A0A4Y1MTP2_9PROT|nr:Hypothetical protein RADP37_04743 [Roseomonas mucosa]